MIMNAKQVCIW